MAKKTSQSGAAKGTSSESLWLATGLLLVSDNNVSSITRSKLAKTKTALGQDAVVVSPKSDERADWYREGWVCLYYYPFDIGIPFPFSSVIKDVLISMRVSPGQLMPFAWRTLACLEAIEKKHHLGINAEVVKCCYGIKKFYGCRFGFTNIRGDVPLILNAEGVNDRHWKESFCFAERSSLGEGGSYFLERWDSTGNVRLFPCSLCIYTCMFLFLSSSFDIVALRRP